MNANEAKRRFTETLTLNREILQKLIQCNDFTVAEKFHISFCIGAVEQEYGRRLDKDGK